MIQAAILISKEREHAAAVSIHDAEPQSLDDDDGDAA